MSNNNNVQKSFQDLPGELKSSKCFSMRDIQANNGKAEEIFCNPITKQLINQDNCTNPDSYENLDDVEKYLSSALPDAQLAAGIINGTCAIRIEQCLDEKGTMDKEAGRIVDKMDSYTEKTPDGAGLTILFKAPGVQFDENLYNTSDKSIGLEVLIEGHTGKCITLSGESLTPGLGLEERSDRFREIMGKYLKKPTPAPAAQPQTALICDSSAKSCMDDFELVLRAKSAKNGDKFKALMDGDASAYGGDTDKAVSALLCMIAFWSGKDAKQMDRIFRTSKLMFPDWDKPSQNNPDITVGEASIKAAISFTKGAYSPKKKLGRSAQELIVHSENGPIPLAAYKPDLAVRRNDIGISKLFSDVYKKECRYVAERKKWYIYNGKVWTENELGAMELAKEFTEALLEYAQSIPISTDEDEISRREMFIKYVQKLQKRGAREILLKDAASKYPIHMGEFDTDPYIFNCRNCTLDLGTMKAYPHNPEDLLTKMADVFYDSQAVCPRWEQHMDEITEGDAKLKKYMQKAFGYALTGDTRFECFFILFGSTSRNGKGTPMDTVLSLLGDYGRAAMPDTLAQRLSPNGSGPSEDIARLAGARLVNISEPDQKMVLSTSLVKTLTGNDTVTVRFLYENNFEYRPTYKIFINTNYLPKASDITIFRSGRVKVIPFNHRFIGAGQDNGLKGELRKPENLSGVLNWCIEGLRILETEGFDEPDAVKRAVDKYAKDSDKIARFMEEYMEENPYGEILTDEAYRVFDDWCKFNGQFAGATSLFKQSLESHGVTVKKTRPRDKSLGTNPRSMIQGYSWQSGRKPVFAPVLPENEEGR